MLMFKRALQKVTTAMIDRYLGGRGIHVVRDGDLIGVGVYEVVSLTDDGRYVVSIKLAVRTEPTKENPLGLRVDTVKVEYPAISWDGEREAFVARLNP